MDSVGQPPPGGDRNLGPAVIALNCVVFTSSSLIVILRTVTRIWITHNFGWDDAVMVLTQVQNIVYPSWCADWLILPRLSMLVEWASSAPKYRMV